MSSYLSKTNRTVPQSEPLRGQVPNNAGGHAWSASLHTKLVRFLILGTQGGSYYESEAKLTRKNVSILDECFAADFAATLSEIVDVSVNGRAGKQDQVLFALAVACSWGITVPGKPTSPESEKERKLALDQIPVVCRTASHLFMFLSFVKDMRGWGMGLRKAVAGWYENTAERDNDALAYQLIKYRQRDGWTHRDVARKVHPEVFGSRNTILEWVTTGEMPVNPVKLQGLPNFIKGFELAQASTSADEAAEIVQSYGLPREAVPTEHLNDPAVWIALLPQMPLGALVRNLATMTRNGTLVKPTDRQRTGSVASLQMVLAKLSDDVAIKKSRIHPVQVLAALMTYAAGRSARGSNTWEPISSIVTALEQLFYASFGNVKPTGKRHLLALDVSGSMSFDTLMGIPGLTPRVASAAMAMVAMRTGDPYEVVAFTGGGHRFNSTQGIHGLSVLDLRPEQSLADVVRAISGLPFGGTDCALPAIWAEKKQKEFDLISILTDSETWAGHIHPDVALKNYRAKSGLDTKLAVIGMVSNDFSVANPGDPNQLDLAGFDTSTPNILAEFAAGRL